MTIVVPTFPCIPSVSLCVRVSVCMRVMYAHVCTCGCFLGGGVRKSIQMLVEH